MTAYVRSVSRTLFRAMLADAEDGAPRTGNLANLLGVRPGDIRGERPGPGLGGLSVTVDDWRKMRMTVRPRAFGGQNEETTMYQVAGVVIDRAPDLQLGSINPKKLHAEIEARSVCSVDEFQANLAATRLTWAVVNDPPNGEGDA